jgi:hypothetical protein
MIDLHEYKDLARESAVYADIELDILDETLSAWSANPGMPCALVELRDGRILAGFAVLRREEAAESTFNIQAVFVGPSYLGTSVTENLLAKMEDEVRRAAASAILRFETSTKKATAFDVDALAKAGYSLIGHIPDFYARGDDYFMYAKHLNLRGREPEDGRGDKREERR